jgi:hypothetical protein
MWQDQGQHALNRPFARIDETRDETVIQLNNSGVAISQVEVIACGIQANPLN